MKKIPYVISSVSNNSSSEFKDLPQINENKIAKYRIYTLPMSAEQGVETGIWECKPGVFKRQVSKKEFSHFIEGHCHFTPDGSESIELKAGDSAYFPANCDGTWIVHKEIKKTFIIFD